MTDAMQIGEESVNYLCSWFKLAVLGQMNNAWLSWK